MKRDGIKTNIIVMTALLLCLSSFGCRETAKLVGLAGAPGKNGHNGGVGPAGPAGPPGDYGAALLPCPGCVENGDLADGAVGSLELVTGAVKNRNIINGAIHNSALDIDAVTRAKLQAQAVTTSKILPGEVTDAKLALGSVVAGDIAAGAVQPQHIAAGAVQSCDIASSAVQAGDFAAGAVVAGDIAPGAVQGVNIQNGAVQTQNIVLGAINHIWTKSGQILNYYDPADWPGSPWLTMYDMSITFTARGGAYAVVFNGGFYSYYSNGSDVQVRLLDGATVLELQRLPSVSKGLGGNYVCSDCAGAACILPAHIHSSAQYLGSVAMHWTGELAAGNHTISVEWKNAGTSRIDQDPTNSDRSLTIIEFARTTVDTY